ncbi:MAG: sugar phosphate nucleotidyltransferase [Chloroflexota bacterium]
MALHNVLAVILGGGRGTRLWPLTKLRAKPAVPIGGKYRLVDIALSNCLNSGIQQIAVLTQFNSVSLHRHIGATYHFDAFHPGWVQIWAAEQTFASGDWYQGTADAVRKQLFEIQVTGASDVLILAGDHLYRMDYAALAEYHWQCGADVTVAVKPVPGAEAHRFGIVRQAPDGRITDFVEKPESVEVLAGFASRDDPSAPYLGSMGIYLFKIGVLLDLLDSEYDDFGSDVLPAAIHTHRVYGYGFDGYWEDIGTIRAFYHANLLLTQPDPPFSFHDPVRPVYTHPRFLAASRIHDVRLDNVLLADGCIVEGAEIVNSIIGLRSVIRDDVVIRDTVIMGADFYEGEAGPPTAGAPAMGIGRGARICGAIIDKNACIGQNVRIDCFPPGTNLTNEHWTVRDGIVVVPKNAVIPSGSVIAP